MLFSFVLIIYVISQLVKTDSLRFSIIVISLCVSGCAGIGPYDGLIMRCLSALLVIAAIFFAAMSFAVEERNGGERWDNYCGICFCAALAFYLVG